MHDCTLLRTDCRPPQSPGVRGGGLLLLGIAAWFRRYASAAGALSTARRLRALEAVRIVVLRGCATRRGGKGVTVSVLSERTEMAEREAPSELDELFERLEQMRIPEGFKAEIVEGIIHVSPQRRKHWRIIRGVLRQLENHFGEEAEIDSDVRVDFPPHLNGFAPDLAKIRDGAELPDTGRWSPADLELVLEVISRGTADNDYGKKKRAYALAGVDIYLIADPYTGQCHVHSRPADDQFWSRQTFKFGDDIDLKIHGMDLVLKTADFPKE